MSDDLAYDIDSRLRTSAAPWAPKLARVRRIKVRRRRRRVAAATATCLLLVGIGSSALQGFTTETEIRTAAPGIDGGEATETLPSVASPATTAPETTIEPSPDAVSGCRAVGPNEVEGLPAPVLTTRNAMATVAAERCDALDDMAELTGPEFTASFGGGTAIEVWSDEIQRNGNDPIEVIAALLDGDAAFDAGSQLWIWPAGAAGDKADTFIGPRLGIAVDGTWEFFVLAGD